MDRFLHKVYETRGATEIQNLYDTWAGTYEAEIAENGYVTPGRCAKALRDCSRDPDAPILDFGCGTGLSGMALRSVGFTTLDGVDISRKMLALADEKTIYRRLKLIKAGTPLACTPGDYAAVSAIGVIGTGAAPITVFDTLMSALGSGGLLVFSFNDHTLAEPEYAGRIKRALETGEARERFREHGEHLRGLGLGSTVYVLEKT